MSCLFSTRFLQSCHLICYSVIVMCQPYILLSPLLLFHISHLYAYFMHCIPYSYGPDPSTLSVFFHFLIFQFFITVFHTAVLFPMIYSVFQLHIQCFLSQISVPLCDISDSWSVCVSASQLITIFLLMCAEYD